MPRKYYLLLFGLVIILVLARLDYFTIDRTMNKRDYFSTSFINSESLAIIYGFQTEDIGVDDTAPPLPGDPNTKPAAITNYATNSRKTNILEIFPIFMLALLYHL